MSSLESLNAKHVHVYTLQKNFLGLLERGLVALVGVLEVAQCLLTVAPVATTHRGDVLQMLWYRARGKNYEFS